MDEEHPGGDAKHGGPKQLLRLFLLLSYFMTCCCSYVFGLLWLLGSMLNEVTVSFSRNSWAYRYTGIIETTTMPIWRSRSSPLGSSLRL